MLVIGTFEHSIELEQVLAVLEHRGISRKHIMVVPMDTDPKTSTLFTGKSQDFYYKGIEVGVACATASSVIGTSIGFILALGPVFWGLAAALMGFAIGFGIYAFARKGNLRRLPKKLPEITVIVQCMEEQSLLVEETMWKYSVLTVGRAPEPT